MSNGWFILNLFRLWIISSTKRNTYVLITKVSMEKVTLSHRGHSGCTIGFKRTGRFKIQFLDPNSLQMPQIFLHSETDISRIDKFGRKGTVIHRLMIPHPLMIHFCYINNFLKNTYSFMKQNLLNTLTSFLSVSKIWERLDKFQACCISFKSRIFDGISQELSHGPPPNDTPVFWEFLNRNGSKFPEIWRE